MERKYILKSWDNISRTRSKTHVTDCRRELITSNVIVFTMKQFSPLRDPTPYKKQGYDRRRVREQRPIILWCLNIPDMKHGFWFVSTPLMTLERSRLEEYFI